MSDGTRVGLVLAAVFAAGAVQSAYLPLWLADRGLTAGEIGFVLGVSSLLRVAGVPGGGWIADRVGRRTVFVVAALCAAGAAGVMPGLHGLWWLLVAATVLGVGSSLLSPLADAVTLGLARARRLDYGRTRAWGSVAYMAATAAAGAVLGQAGSGVVPGLVLVGYGLAGVGGFWLPEAAGRLARGVRAAGPFGDKGFRLALIATGLIQGSHAAYYSFAPLHWRAAGLSDAVIGLLIAEGIVAEVALFVWGRGLVERLGSARLTAVAAGACVVRWTALAFVTDARALAVLQFLHAGTFACQHLSTMMVLQRLPSERAGMAQTVMSALGFSAATAALVWLTGQLYGPYGGLSFLPMAVVGGAAVFTVRPLSRVMAIR